MNKQNVLDKLDNLINVLEKAVSFNANTDRIAELKDIINAMEGRRSSWDDEDRRDYEEVVSELEELTSLESETR